MMLGKVAGRLVRTPWPAQDLRRNPTESASQRAGDERAVPEPGRPAPKAICQSERARRLVIVSSGPHQARLGYYRHVTTVPAHYLDKIVSGDCLTVLKALPDSSVDLVISSPPYNIGKEYEATVELSRYLDEQRVVLAQCARVLADTGSIFWQVGTYVAGDRVIPLDVRFFPILEELGLIPRNRIVWIRQHGLHANRRFSGRHETILWFAKTPAFRFDLSEIRVPQKYPNKRSYRGESKGQLSSNPDGKNPGDVWVFRNVKHNHEEQTLHPAQFPEDLVARIVRATTAPGDTVLDPYMGAGTVAAVARDLGRHYVGAEINPDYCSIAERRLAGTPDRDGRFPNLRTLRAYAAEHGLPPARFRFDTQVGQAATGAHQARIFDEEEHLEELAARLDWEERAGAARVRGLEVEPWQTRLVPEKPRAVHVGPLLLPEPTQERLPLDENDPRP